MDLDALADRLFADASAVDAEPADAQRLLSEHWALLAGGGLLGVQARGGTEEASRILGVLAGACLTTAFLWLQHEGATAAVAVSPMADELLPGLCDGTIRAGLALAGLRPGPDQLRATPAAGGWGLDGLVPWVTGFGIVDQLQVAAVDGEEVVFLLVPASAAGLTGAVQPLSAAAASRTATVRFDAVRVGADRELRRVPAQDWADSQQYGVGLNGFLALGVAERCARLASNEDLVAEIEELAARLRGCGPQAVPGLRAQASLLGVRAATTLVVATGSRAALRGTPAERLWREASFLLVFGSRPLIRAALLDQSARAS